MKSVEKYSCHDNDSGGVAEVMMKVSVACCDGTVMVIAQLRVGTVYFRHAGGLLLILSKNMAQYININSAILKTYAHDDISVGSWMMGLQATYIDDSHLCCGSSGQGNGKVGRVVLAAAAKHLTPVVLELGGKSPVIVATRRIIAGKWGGNNGQACVSPDYIITTKDYAPKLVDALKTELKNFYGDDQLNSKDLSRIVSSNHFARLTKLLDDDKVSGKIVHGGQRDESNLKIAPTILLDVPEDSLIMTAEIFGPLLPILTVKS
ncbi:hypothetical protein RJ640_011613 [Escallonia rubra]|uniref:Aldehyde dehydrogenase domain-containing protein n=1 Tax=Escallonia rubra TaxID=112253 RepID=A0AA88UPB7_9ASTE|nr:hypothetical protein RJ640_011613 [Escallonia rubra]